MTAAAARRLDRAGREAARFVRDARRLARRHARALGKAGDEIEAAAVEVEAAAAEGEPDRLSVALQELSHLWDTQLAPRQKPLWLEVVQIVALAVLLAAGTRTFLFDTARVVGESMEPTLLPGDVLLVRRSAYAVRVPFTRLRLFDTGAPRRGDLVVFDDPRDPGATFVKRVIGVPGDVVELREQVLYVNGVPQPRDRGADYALAQPGGVSICRRYRESLARGALEAPAAGSGPEARWQAAAAGGVAAFDVLQCRLPRPDTRQGPYAVEPGHVFVLGDNRDLSADSRALGGRQIPYGNLRGRAGLVLLSWGDGGSWFRGTAGLRLDRLFKAVATR